MRLRRFAFERRQKIANAVDHAPEIDAHEPFEVGDGELFEGAVHGDAGVIDQQGNAFVLGEDFGGELFDLLGVGDVEDVGRNRGCWAAELGDSFLRVSALTSAMASDIFSRGEELGEFAADAGAGAGDDGYSA